MTAMVILVFVAGVAIFAAWSVSRRYGSVFDPPSESQPVVVSIDMNGVRRQRDSIVAKLHLSRAEREAIIEAYRDAFTDSGVWPDIKLEAFLELVSTTPASAPVPVFFAQKRIVLAFAQSNNLVWLQQLIERECMRSLNPIPEDVP